MTHKNLTLFQARNRVACGFGEIMAYPSDCDPQRYAFYAYKLLETGELRTLRKLHEIQNCLDIRGFGDYTDWVVTDLADYAENIDC